MSVNLSHDVSCQLRIFRKDNWSEVHNSEGFKTIFEKMINHAHECSLCYSFQHRLKVAKCYGGEVFVIQVCCCDVQKYGIEMEKDLEVHTVLITQ